MSRTRKHPELRGLYAITPDWPDTRRLLSVTEAILGAGCRVLQYRHKRTSDCHRQEQALALRRLTRQYGALLLINDDVELACYCEADGVHLGEEDGALATARERLGPEAILGASCYQSPDLARTAAQQGADYVAFGSMYPSPTKPQADRAGIDLLGTEVGLPVCAIGGITPDNAAPLVTAGADLVAIISALYDAPNPAGAARQFISLYEAVIHE